jgi:hypothetical protein
MVKVMNRLSESFESPRINPTTREDSYRKDLLDKLNKACGQAERGETISHEQALAHFHHLLQPETHS